MVRNQITDRVGCMIKRRKDMKRLGFVSFRLFYVKIINKNYKRIQKGYKYTVYWGQDLRYWGGNMKYNILLVEDEQKIAEGIMDYMKGTDAEFTWADDGDKALALVYENEYDMALLDVMLPGADGFEICRAIRSKSYVPVIFLTARGREEDRLYGYDIGCDDYVVKPFSMAELSAKIMSFLRRSKGLWEKNSIEAYDIVIYPDKLQVFVSGKELRLAPKEYAMLKYFMEHRGILVTRDDLLLRLWGYDYEGSDRVVDNHIKKLRQALGESGKQIKTVFAKGYRMD